LSVFTHYLQSTTYQLEYVQYAQGLCQSRLGTADYALLLVATATTAVSHLSGRMLDRQVKVKVKVKVTLQLTVSQSVCLGVEPLLGLMTRYFFF
jgi:hypothetical protein